MNKQKIVLFLARKDVIGVVAFVSGAAIGASSTYFSVKNKLKAHYEDLANEEIMEARHVIPLKEETPEEMLSRLHPEAGQALLNYQGGPREKVEGPFSTEEELEVETPVVVEAENVNIFAGTSPIKSTWDAETEKRIRDENPDRPYIISHDEFYQNEMEYDSVDLTYFQKDGTLVDEQDKPIPDAASDEIVGDDNLMRFGHGSLDANMVYVQNDASKLIFSVSRNFGSYAEELFGISEGDDGLQHGMYSRGKMRLRED